MRQLILTTIMFLMVFAIQVNAQTSLQLTYYQNIDVATVTERRENNAGSFDEFSTKYHNNFTRPSLGILWDLRNDQYRNGFELSYSRFAAIKSDYVNRFPNISPSPSNLTESFLSVSYQLDRRMNDDDCLMPIYLGVFLTGYHHYRLDDPVRSFKSADRNLGFLLGINPRLVFLSKTRFKMEVGSKISFFDLSKYTFRVDNPQIPISNQRFQNRANLDFLPKAFNLQVGISYSIN
jgi:hypothetical protein